jgi:lysozyme family protein
MNRRTFLFATPVALAVLTASTVSAQLSDVTVQEVRTIFEQRPIDARRMVQKALKGTGYYDGTIDGVWGPGTAEAYRVLIASDRYQRHASRWTWSREVQVIETMFFLNSDAYP